MKRMKLKEELLEIIRKQTETVERQGKLIIELANENAEKENIINELMRNSIELPY